MLAGDILRRTAARLPGKTGLIEGECALSFAELDRAVDRCAAALAAIGLAKGSVAAILAPNLLEYPVLYFGAARAGVILAALSPRATARDIVYMLNKAEARALVFAAEAAPLVREARAAAPMLSHLFAIGAVAGEEIPGVSAFADLLASAPAVAPRVEIALDDPLAMTFTGGTTGLAKAVLVSHRARFASAETVATEFGLDERDVTLVATPMFHAAGLFVWYLPSVLLGCASVLLPRWDPASFVELVERHRVTAALLVPTQIADLLGHPAFDARRLASLRHMSHAGAPMPLALHDRLLAALPGIVVVENYGQSETGPMTVRGPGCPHDKRGSVGRPARNVETRIVDVEGNEVAAGVVGEVVTRGPHLLSAYYRDPEQTAALYKTGKGWLWTGDLGQRDAEGYIWLVDRAKDMIVAGAENIYPTEIENALYQHPAVAECAVFGIPDDKWGEVPAAHVVLKPGQAVTGDELMAFVGTRIARWKRPRLVAVVESLPRTAVGKIQKHLIREPYWRGRERKI